MADGDQFGDGEAMALQRAMGRLEGKIEGYVARQANFESVVQRQLDIVAKEVISTREKVANFKDDKNQIESVAKEVAELRVDVDSIKTDRSLIRGGWRTVVGVTVAFGGIVIFIITVLNFFMVTVVKG